MKIINYNHLNALIFMVSICTLYKTINNSINTNIFIYFIKYCEFHKIFRVYILYSCHEIWQLHAMFIYYSVDRVTMSIAFYEEEAR